MPSFLETVVEEYTIPALRCIFYSISKIVNQCMCIMCTIRNDTNAKLVTINV